MTTAPLAGDKFVLVKGPGDRVVGMGSVPLATTIAQNGTAIAHVGHTAEVVDVLVSDFGTMRDETAVAIEFAKDFAAEADRLGTSSFGQTIQALTMENPDVLAIAGKVNALDRTAASFQVALQETQYDTRAWRPTGCTNCRCNTSGRGGE